MYYNKVEICGINTSDLKTIDEKEKIELIIKAQKGDNEALDEVVCGNLKLVLSVVQKFSGRGYEADDLFQVGVIGLIKAVKNFDTEKNVKFSTYGVPMIFGEVRRFLRDNNSVRVSRSIRDLAYKTMQAKELLTARLDREPTIEELSIEIDMPESEISIALEAVSDPVSIYEPMYSDDGDSVYIMDQLGDSNSDKDWINEIHIKETIKSLSERDKEILILRFMKGKTQMEVAKEIGISQAQVSRLEKNALDKIKN